MKNGEQKSRLDGAPKDAPPKDEDSGASTAADDGGDSGGGKDGGNRAAIFLGIDPGLARTGWGVVRRAGRKLIFVAGGAVRTTPDMTLPQRLAAIGEELTAVITAHRPNFAAVERVFINMNPGASLALGEARGAAIAFLTAQKLPVREFTALQVKQILSGYGRADKRQMEQIIRRLLLIPPRKKLTLDTVDALCCAVACAEHEMLPPEARAALEQQRAPQARHSRKSRDSFAPRANSDFPPRRGDPRQGGPRRDGGRDFGDKRGFGGRRNFGGGRDSGAWRKEGGRSWNKSGGGRGWKKDEDFAEKKTSAFRPRKGGNSPHASDSPRENTGGKTFAHKNFSAKRNPKTNARRADNPRPKSGSVKRVKKDD